MNRVYTSVQVERLLRSYLDFRHTLFGQGQRLMDSSIVDKPHPSAREQPLGQTRTGSPWPFLEPQHAKVKVDGKRKAKLFEGIWVSMMDLEEGLKHLSDDDIELVYKFHLFQTRTLDELCAEKGIKSKTTMSRRIHAAVDRLTFYMDGGACAA